MENVFILNLLLLAIGVNSECSAPLGEETDITFTPGEECLRTCQRNDSRICYFKFVLENYQAMGVACKNCSLGVEADCNHPQCIIGDGIGKSVMSTNRQIPGPPIQICVDDVLVVDIDNRIHGTSTTIHWHGLSMRLEPFMDGVPFVTQCPIHAGTTFRYQFKVPEYGTYFYHSHTGFHRTNGIYGTLIVRQPIEDNAQASLYDFDLPEHHFLITDYLHTHAEELFPGYPHSHPQSPDALTINGRGTYVNPFTSERVTAPPTQIFYVSPQKRYRMRAIDAGSFICPVLVQVQNHRLTVIATDADDVNPRTYDSIVLNAGERYDFVLTADQDPGDYWIRFRGLSVCESRTLTDSFILLRYNDTENGSDLTKPRPPMPDYGDNDPMGEVLNYPNVTCLHPEDNCVTELRSLNDDLNLRTARPDVKFFLAFNNYDLDNNLVFTPGKYYPFRDLQDLELDISAINNITFVSPTSPPLTQPNDVDPSTYCDQDNIPENCDGVMYCPCVHRLYIETGSIVELIIVDETRSPDVIHHPFHLHGYHFQVIEIGQHPLGIPMTVNLAKRMDAEGKFSKISSPNPPRKDTASIPSAGFARVRFRANNPGYWFFHCHFEWHTVMGLDLIFQVGQNYEMRQPRPGFPRCGDYLPEYQPYD